MARVSSRFLGNSFNIEGQDESHWRCGLFPTVARINHSCTPNAHSNYRATTGAQCVFSLRDIQAGEEIEIAYFDITAPLAERRARAVAWSFTCRCPACSNKLKATYERDLAAVHEWSKLDTKLQFHYPKGSSHLLSRIQHALSIARSDNYPWLRVALPSIYGSHAGALMNNRRPVYELRDALEQSLLWRERINGAGNPEVVKSRAEASMLGIPKLGEGDLKRDPRAQRNDKTALPR